MLEKIQACRKLLCELRVIKNENHNNQFGQQQLAATPRCPYASMFGLAFLKRKTGLPDSMLCWALPNIAKKMNQPAG